MAFVAAPTTAQTAYQPLSPRCEEDVNDSQAPQTPTTWAPNCVVRRHNSGVERVANWSSCCKIVSKLEITENSSRLGDILKIALFAIANVALAVVDVAKGAFTVIKGAVTKVICCCKKAEPTPPKTAEEIATEELAQSQLEEMEGQQAPNRAQPSDSKECSRERASGELRLAINVDQIDQALTQHGRSLGELDGRLAHLTNQVPNNLVDQLGQLATGVQTFNGHLRAQAHTISLLDSRNPARALEDLNRRLALLEQRAHAQMPGLYHAPSYSGLTFIDPHSSSSSSSSSSSFQPQVSRQLSVDPARVDRLEADFSGLQSLFQNNQNVPQPQALQTQPTAVHHQPQQQVAQQPQLEPAPQQATTVRDIQ